MNKEEFKKILSSKKEFKNIDKWKFKWIPHGGVSPHTYIISEGKKKYFVKEIKDNEKKSLHFINSLKIKLSPKIIHPDLLRRNVLVQKYIKGSHIRNKKLPLDLIKEYVKMQNASPKKIVSKSKKRLHHKKHSTIEWLTRNLISGRKRLFDLRKYRLGIVNDFIRISNIIFNNRSLLNEYSKVPVSWIHHDFKENNIIKEKKTGKVYLVDWGSSYGQTHFTFDLAPFIIDDKKAKDYVFKKHRLCKGVDKETFERWIYLSVTARFLNFIKFRLNKDNFNNKKECKKFLEYEYKPFKHLVRSP